MSQTLADLIRNSLFPLVDSARYGQVEIVRFRTNLRIFQRFNALLLDFYLILWCLELFRARLSEFETFYVILVTFDLFWSVFEGILTQFAMFSMFFSLKTSLFPSWGVCPQCAACGAPGCLVTPKSSRRTAVGGFRKRYRTSWPEITRGSKLSNKSY